MTRAPLPKSFFTRLDPTIVAQDLLGKHLVTNYDGHCCIGRITETEAYWGPHDKACHAYAGRRTKRTEIMFWSGGHAYVTLIYGMHTMFNVVTGPPEDPQAVLIRGLEPVAGTDHMLSRRGFDQIKPQLSAGPGVLTKAMGIQTDLHGQDLLATDSPVWLEEGDQIAPADVKTGPRVGIDYAEEWVNKPWRFWIKNNPWVSKTR